MERSVHVCKDASQRTCRRKLKCKKPYAATRRKDKKGVRKQGKETEEG
jgi:hypothetical protein